MLCLEQVLAVLLASSEVIPPVRKSTIFCGQSLIASDGRTCRRTEESAFAEVFGQNPLEILSVRWLSDFRDWQDSRVASVRWVTQLEHQLFSTLSHSSQ